MNENLECESTYNANRSAYGVKNSGYGYDLNGNLTVRPTAGGVQTLVWDAENRLASVSGGGLASESYSYDDGGQRVKKTSGDQATYTVGGHYEVMRGGCSGETPSDASNWQAYGSTDIYLDVDTSGCGFGQTPVYVASLGGHSGSYATTGGNAIYLPTPTGFRVYVRYVNSAPISPAQANSYGWQLNWTALPTAANRVETKYYHFAGQRIAMKRNSVFTYLHNDHLGSPVLTTSSSASASQVYYVYGKVRSYSGSFPTRYQFTGQHIDGSDLTYMNARYYDRRTGQFISPDTLVPDAGLLVDYNRFMYARGNPLKYNDPTGHQAQCMAMQTGEPLSSTALVLGCQAVDLAVRYGPTVVQLASQWADKVPALGDWLSSTSNRAQNAAQLSNFGQFDPSNFNLDPNQFDPDKTKKVTEMGQEAHRQFRDEFRSQMQQLGREEKAGDFLTERGVRDAFGKVARIEGQYGRPDAVDYKNHIIYELKPWMEGGERAIRARYADQIELYEKLYKEAYGVMPNVQIVIYGQPPH